MTREKLEIQNQLALVREEQGQFQVGGASMMMIIMTMTMMMVMMMIMMRWPLVMFCDLQASVEQLTKEKWELSAANTDLQQRLQQTVTMAHMQVLSQISFYFDENQGNLD